MELPLTYAITDKILNNVAKIDVIQDFINRASILPAWEKQLRHKAKIKSTHYSTRIEGNRLTLAQVEDLSKQNKVQGVTRNDIIEVQNYFKVLDYIETVASNTMVFTHDIILKMHYITINGILEGDLKGKYRIQQNVVMNSSTGDIEYMPPPYDEVPGLMDQLVKFLNNSSYMHPVLKAAIAHYEFVRIHPFMDGNGRVARALAMLVLYVKGYDLRKLFALEEYYERDRQNYYAAIDSVRMQKGNVTGWIEYFVAGMLGELERVKQEIVSIEKDMGVGVPCTFNPRQMEAITYIRKNGAIRNAEYRGKFKVSNKTAQSDLQMMVDAALLKIEGKGRSLKYYPVTEQHKEGTST